MGYFVVSIAASTLMPLAHFHRVARDSRPIGGLTIKPQTSSVTFQSVLEF
jgi:hypothetical protein